MKGRKLLSGIAALGIVMTAFSGITSVANAAAENVTFFPQGGSQITLNAGNKDYEDIASFENGKVTFNKDITLVANGVSGTYGTCLSATTTSNPKTLTLEIPTGVTVKMDNSNAGDSWRTALNATSTGDLTITGGGTLIIDGKGATGYGITPYGKSVTIDNVTVKTAGTTCGVGYYSNGSMTLKNGGVIEAIGGTKAFEAASLTADNAEVMVGNDAASAEAGTIADIASYKYAKITTKSTGTEPTEEPTETPEPTEAPEPTATPVPTPTPIPHSDWIGIQIKADGVADWYYDNHYLMPDGKHYNPTNQAEGFQKGDEVMYYDKTSGTIEFNKDITLYGLKDDLAKYYGAAIVPALEKDFTVRINNNATVTINATNRVESAYLYGLYSTGHLVIEGNGTLKIKSDKGKSDNAALCVFSGNKGECRASLTVKDNIKLVLENTDANGYGMHVYGTHPGIGDVIIQDNASVEMTGGKSAVTITADREGEIINKTPVVNGDQKIFVGADKNNIAEWDTVTDISTYKYVKIAKEAAAEISTECIGAAKGTDNSVATGFVTEINNVAAIETVGWNVTYAEGDIEIPAQNFANIDGNVKIGLIISGLYDENASAKATVNGSLVEE